MKPAELVRETVRVDSESNFKANNKSDFSIAAAGIDVLIGNKPESSNICP